MPNKKTLESEIKKETLRQAEINAVAEKDYIWFLAQLQKQFERAIKNAKLNDGSYGPIFTTDAKLSFDKLFLAELPEEHRQHYDCRLCRRFVENYGGLVTISITGIIKSVMWDQLQAPSFFKNAVRGFEREVNAAKVTGVFLSSDRTWGTLHNIAQKGPYAGTVFNHMAISPPVEMLFQSKLLTPNQAMADKKERFKMLRGALADYSQVVVDQAYALLKSNQLPGSEHALPQATFFKELLQQQAITRDKTHKRNVVWYHAATAGDGMCNVKGNMLGQLLDDLTKGLSTAKIKERFAKMSDPEKRLRPQNAPAEGNIAQAEKIIDKLGAKFSLERRYARLDEIPEDEIVWERKEKKAEPKKEGGAVFEHIRSRQSEHSEASGRDLGIKETLTWEKFQRTVLPDAEKIEFQVPHGESSYFAILTAEHADAPPIIQWDTEEQRNPFSWYLYTGGGSDPKIWGLKAGTHHEVEAITLQPSMWNKGEAQFAHQGAAVMFILKDCKDLNAPNSVGNALFPAILKSELHQIRQTIEAYSNTAKLGGYDEASACGIRLQKGLKWYFRFRVTHKDNRVVNYTLDRWD